MSVRRYRAKQTKTDPYLIMPLMFLCFLVVVIKVGLILGAIVLACGIIFGIIYWIMQAIDEKEARKREIEEKKAFLQSNPPIMATRAISQKTDGYSEMENIRQKFEKFVKEEDVLIGKKTYLDWLVKKSAIQKELGIEAESQQELDDKMIKVRTEIGECEAKLGECTLSRYRLSWLRNDGEYNKAFEVLKSKLDKKSGSETLNFFFRDVPKGFYSGFHEFEYIFTPLFILKYYNPAMRFELIEYRNVDVTLRIDTKLKEDGWNPQDEVAFYHWEYERKDGGPDLRYKYNRRRTYIYQGTVCLHVDFHDVEFKFPNKTLAEEFKGELMSFLNLTRKKPYCDDIEKLINGVADGFEEKVYRTFGAIISPTMIKPGLAVVHSTFGKGKIINIEGRYMTVQFNNFGNKKFKYPEAVQSEFFRLDE